MWSLPIYVRAPVIILTLLRNFFTLVFTYVQCCCHIFHTLTKGMFSLDSLWIYKESRSKLDEKSQIRNSIWHFPPIFKHFIFGFFLKDCFFTWRITFYRQKKPLKKAWKVMLLFDSRGNCLLVLDIGCFFLQCIFFRYGSFFCQNCEHYFLQNICQFQYTWESYCHGQCCQCIKP